MPLLIRYFELRINFNWADYDGRTALHFAIVGGHLNVVKFLVEKCKVWCCDLLNASNDLMMIPQADVSVQDRWGNTPLDDSIKKGSYNHITQYLLLHNYAALPVNFTSATL